MKEKLKRKRDRKTWNIRFFRPSFFQKSEEFKECEKDVLPNYYFASFLRREKTKRKRKLKGLFCLLQDQHARNTVFVKKETVTKGNKSKHIAFLWRSVNRTPVFFPVFSLRVCMHIRSFSVSFDMCWHSHDVTMFSWLKTQKQGKEFPASSTCSTTSCCLVCSGLHARYTDTFNGSNRFPFSTWTQVVFRSRARARFSDGGRGYCSGHGKIGGGSMFRLQQWWSRLNSASTPSIESGHRSQGYTAQWLKRLTADQQVPVSIPGGGHGLPSWHGHINWQSNNILMINIMSPITTSIKTITRKSVNMVAELSNDTAASWILDITERLEGNPVVTKVLHAIALKTPSRFGADAVVDWMQWSGVPILAGGPAADRMPGQAGEPYIPVWVCRVKSRAKSNTFD